MRRREEQETRKDTLEKSEREARPAEPEEAEIQAAKENTIIEDSLKKTLNVAGGSKEDRERKIRVMLAKLMRDTSASDAVDITVTIASPADATRNTANKRSSPHVPDYGAESPHS